MTSLTPPSIASGSLYPQLASLLVFQGLFTTGVGKAFMALLESLYLAQTRQRPGYLDCLHCYGQWFRQLAIADVSWQDWLVQRILEDDNPFSR